MLDTQAAADQAAGWGWSVIGPGGGGGQFIPTINPADSNNVFVRCDMTGAYVTLDGGQSWRMFNLRTVVEAFAFDPGEPNTVYAANTALYRSEDRGGRWQLIYPAPKDVVAEHMLGDHAEQWFETTDGMPDGPLDQVRVDPLDSDRIYLGLSAYRFPTARGSGYSRDSTRLVVSKDWGKSWRLAARVYGRQVLALFPGAWDNNPGEITVATDLCLARIVLETGEVSQQAWPAGRVVAAAGGQSPAGSVYYCLSGLEQPGDSVSGGVYRTSDRGASWVQVNTGLLEDESAGGRLPRFETLAVCEGDPRAVYLSCSAYPFKSASGIQSHFGIFRTKDSGENWHWAYRANDETVLTHNYSGGWMQDNYGPSWAGNPISLGVSPTDPGICYATDYGTTYRTLDGGAWWEQVYSRSLPDSSVTTRGLDVTTCYGLHFDPFDSRHFFISYTDIGLFHTYSGGDSWVQSIRGVTSQWINTCYWLVFDPRVRGRIWSVWANCHDLPRPKMFRGGNFDRFLGGVAVSGDGGKNWQASNAGLPANTVCTHIEIDPASPVEKRVLYVCGFGKGVFKSVDGGLSWDNASRGIGPNLNAWRITRLPDGTLFLLVARGGPEGGEVVDGAVYRSSDGALNWEPVTLPEGVNAPNDLIFDPSEPQRMYLSCWPGQQDGKARVGGLLRTEDGGYSWKRVFPEDTHVYAAAVDPDNPSTVFINTFDSAAFRSDDRGENWYRLEGYNFKWGHRPVPDPHHPGMLYLTTFGGSVFYGPARGVPGAFEDIVEKAALRWK